MLLDLLCFGDVEAMQARDLVLVNILDITISYLFASKGSVLFFNFGNCNAVGMSDDSYRAASAMLWQSQRRASKVRENKYLSVIAMD